MNGKKLITVLFVSLFYGITVLPSQVLATDDIPIITGEILKNKMDSGIPMVLANALSSIEFKDLTIKGSVSIPFSKVKNHPLLPKDKDTLLVFFCKGKL